MTYVPPVTDMLFVMENICGLAEIAGLAQFDHAQPEAICAILDEASRFVVDTIEPLNRAGDVKGAHLHDGGVLTPPGWKNAYDDYARGGWIGAATDSDIGGMGLPSLVGAGLQEMLQSANMSFALCPMLSQGAIKVLATIGADTLKQTYLPKMLSGEWTGTMVLTEPQAGSDLSAVRTRAERHGDRYLISGQKIFITYGDHDLTDNIIHLVLARTSDTGGTKALSLFVVPKNIIEKDGSLGSDNDVRCVSLEHKLGIHGSPTAFLSFGDNGRCVGEIVGEEGRGLEYMFIMMNEARLGIAVQGVGIAERAYQAARSYAKERVQGRIVGDGAGRKPIQYHPDVHRMLMTMRAKCEAMRGIAYLAARSLDLVHAAENEKERAFHQDRLGLLVPIAKGWCTEEACQVASLGIQVHGGMGYIEETGAAQYFRDARITTIYEGTTGIQANDLLARKILRDNGSAMKLLIAEMRALDNLLAERNEREFPFVREALTEGANALETAVSAVMAAGRDAECCLAAAVNLLHLSGLTVGCWVVARGALQAAAGAGPASADLEFRQGKIGVAHFYAGQIMPEVHARLLAIIDPSQSALALYPR